MSNAGKKKDEFHHRPFNKLKKAIKNADHPPPSRPAPPPVPPTEEDEFNEAMNGVQMIPEFRILPCANAATRAVPVRAKPDPDAEALDILKQLAHGTVPINLSDTQEYVEWTNPDARTGLAEELHAGRFSIQGMLDLHGFTSATVDQELDAFLGETFRKGWSCVKIIHGRGLRSVRGPVLKNAVIRRLLGKYRKRVIGFVSARQCDGGLGALYVLLI